MATTETCMLVTTRFSSSIVTFYEEVFPDWTWPGSGTDWVSFDPGEGQGGIICAPIDDPTLAGWHPCVQVKSINDTLSKVTSQGGSVALGKNEFPTENGYYAIIADPQGALLVIREPKS